MTPFRRGIFGVANQHLFYNVDFVVYLEGGHSYTKDEVYQGKYTDDTLDIVFWKKIFKKHKPKKTFKFKSVGSKTTLKNIAEDVLSHNLNSLYLAMDSEFDGILGKRIQSEFVLYTHGYSWENDVWNLNTISSVINTVSGDTINIDDIKGSFDLFVKDIRIGVYADAYLFNKGMSFFPRPNHNKCLECSLKVEPMLKKEEISILLSTHGLNKKTLYSYASRKKIDPLIHCYGHLYDDFCSFFILFFLKNGFSMKNVNKDILRRIAITTFDDILESEENLKGHYHRQLA